MQHAGLVTPAHSPKHMGLYQKYGFWPRFLTAVMSKPVAPGTRPGSWTRYAELPEREQAVCLRACLAVTESVYPGLEVEREIRTVHTQALGDTVLLWEDQELVGLAVCHCGTGTEAGHGSATSVCCRQAPPPSALVRLLTPAKHWRRRGT